MIQQGGDYLMVVKENQGGLYHDLERLFRGPPTLRGEQDLLTYGEPYRGHGRQEMRTLVSSVAPNGVPGLARRWASPAAPYDSVELKSGKTAHEVTYGISSLSRAQALPEHVARLYAMPSSPCYATRAGRTSQRPCVTTARLHKERCNS